MQEAGTSDIAVIVVNYGTAALAIDAVDSVLQRDHGGRRVEVHLVDNASPGGDAELFRAAQAERGWGARVTLHLEQVNHGFGRGNNVVLRALAARAAPPDMVMLLNPDARLENEAIDILARTLETAPWAGMAGAGIASAEGVPATAAFRFPSAASEFVEALNFGPVARLFPRAAVALPPGQPPGRVDWVCGAAVMIRMRTLQDIGFFDPAYFLYYEEVDLMRQAGRAGWQILYVPEARTIHEEGVSTGVRSGDAVRPRRPAYWYRSWLHYFVKNHGRGGAVLAGAAWMAGAAAGHLLARLRGRQPATPARLFGDFWALVGRPLVGLKAARHE